MKRQYKVVAILAFACVLSYFAYVIYWFVQTIPWIIDISVTPEKYSPPTGLRFINAYSTSAAYLMEYAGFFGLLIRVVAASYALVSTFLILKKGTSSFSVVRSKISKALLLEGLHFFSFIPAIYFLLGFSALPSASNWLLSASLLAQIMLISPFLIQLSLKVRKHELGSGSSSLWRLAGFSSMAYAIALWATYMLKWTEMIVLDPYLFTALSIRILGFLNTLIVQSLAVAFAIVGALSIYRKAGIGKIYRWWGLSSIFLSLHIVIYVIYCFSAGSSRFIIFGELWLIPFLGFGAYLLLKNRKFSGTYDKWRCLPQCEI